MYCPISSSSSPPSNKDGDDADRVKDRLEAFMKREPVKQLMDQAGLTPIWAAGTAATLYLLTDYAIRTNRLQTGRPGLFKFGTVVLGAITGVQLSFWRLRCQLKEIDPEGSLQKEAREIISDLQQRGRITTRPKLEVTNKGEEKPQVNKYGDRIDEFK